MSIENVYENFRTVLTMNLCSVIQDPDTLRNVLDMVDMTMDDFEIHRKQMDIIPADDPMPVINYYLTAKGIANLSMKTLKQYRYKLINFFDTVRKSYRDIQTNDIRAYLAKYKIEHNASGSYIDNIRITLNSFFQWLVDDDVLTKNPCAKVEKTKYQPKRRESFSTYNLEDLRWHCEDIREKALIDFLYSTGCRVSECAGVCLTDIDWSSNSVHLRFCKGNKERTVYFNDEAKISLKAYLDSRGHISHALWTSKRAPHQQLQTGALENIVRAVGKRTGLRAYPHKLRHTFATVGMHNGIPLDKLQALLGHTNPQTTLIYAKQDNNQLQMEHQKAFS